MSKEAADTGTDASRATSKKRIEVPKKEWRECDAQRVAVKQLETELAHGMNLDIGETKVQGQTTNALPLINRGVEPSLGELEALSTSHQQANAAGQGTEFMDAHRADYVRLRGSLLTNLSQIDGLPFWRQPSDAKVAIKEFGDLVASTIQATGDFPSKHPGIANLLAKGRQLARILRVEMTKLRQEEVTKQQGVYDRKRAMLDEGGALPREYSAILDDLRETMTGVEPRDFWKQKKYLSPDETMTVSRQAVEVRRTIHKFIPVPGRPVGHIDKEQLQPLLGQVRSLSDDMCRQLREHSEGVVGNTKAITRWSLGAMKCVFNLEKTRGKVAAAVLAAGLAVGGPIIAIKTVGYFKGPGTTPPVPVDVGGQGQDGPGTAGPGTVPSTAPVGTPEPPMPEVPADYR